ncbi:MAG TPA: hypothetical protein VFW45_15415 [Candidatus Polarisedimenticolia bacterium]|nr:hypothetical protein [Candidatus Polarisedimenticolia bacterium]
MNTYHLVPGVATASDATALALAVSLNGPPAQPGQAWIQANGGKFAIQEWSSWLTPDGDAGVLSARVVLNGLQPKARMPVSLYADDAEVASAIVSTLPNRLPTVEEPPLILMLGSCFCARTDKGGSLGNRFGSLPGGLRPDLKILCGDQVYLDSPWYKFLVPHTKNDLAGMFLRNYADAWGQSGELQGFERLLSDGSAIFTSDDHEFWNNAPYPSSFSTNTWTDQGRKDWWEIASRLFKAFQTDAPPVRPQPMVIGDLEIFVVDSRLGRSDDRTTFIPPADMQRLVSWIRQLKSPGILIIGQPLFHEKAGLMGKVADWNLPDFEQYAELCRALLEAPQSVVILTGDVHYGRVAGVVTAGDVEIVEIIASPMSLVTGGDKRKWKPAPDLFPPESIQGLHPLPVRKLSTWERGEDHFVTLELWQSGGGLGVRVRSWESGSHDGMPAPVFEHVFRRS